MSRTPGYSGSSANGPPLTRNRANGWAPLLPSTTNSDWPKMTEDSKASPWLPPRASLSPWSAGLAPLPLSKTNSIWSDLSAAGQDEHATAMDQNTESIWLPQHRRRRFSFVDRETLDVPSRGLWQTPPTHGNEEHRHGTRRHSVASPYGAVTGDEFGLPRDIQAHVDAYFGTPRSSYTADKRWTSEWDESMLPWMTSPAVRYRVEFKAGRIETCYVCAADRVTVASLQLGDWVIVEADRGHDMGKVVCCDTVWPPPSIATPPMDDIDDHDPNAHDTDNSQSSNSHGDDVPRAELTLHADKESQAKRIFRLATREETATLSAKNHSEAQALQVCRTKAKQKQLPMEVVSAEYQWDRRKLTFYFVADQRIDFRELVRDLFKIYKTRIWMSAIRTA